MNSCATIINPQLIPLLNFIVSYEAIHLILLFVEL